MRRVTRLACLLAIGAVASAAVYAQTPPAANSAVVYEGARLIVGSAATPAIENGAFVVQGGVITAIGRTGAVVAPAGATHIDLSGKTVMPALIDMHAHFGYEKYTSAAGDARPEHYTPENLLDHFQREAFYGVGTVNDGGTASIPISRQFQLDQTARNFPPAAQYVFNAAIVPPDGGPDEILIKGTRPLHANYEVITSREARAAVIDIAAKDISHLKIWIGDRGGSYPAMPHEVYDAVIDEAHKHNISVHAHALMSVRDAKDVLRAGADLLVHIVSSGTVDDELLAIVRERKPYFTPTLAARMRREVCDNQPFTTQVLSTRIVTEMLASDCRPNPNAAANEAALKANFQKMLQAGARVVLGTDAGIRPSNTFGSSVHHELAAFVRLGMSPAQAIEAGTSRSAESIGLTDVGTLAAGKHADFLVLNANPLDDILNTRQISAVYLRGARLDRDALLAKWKKADASN